MGRIAQEELLVFQPLDQLLPTIEDLIAGGLGDGGEGKGFQDGHCQFSRCRELGLYTYYRINYTACL